MSLTHFSILLIIAATLTGCSGEIQSSAPAGGDLAKTEEPETPRAPADETPRDQDTNHNQDDHKAPTGAQSQVCFGHTGQTPCYQLYDLNDVHQAEPLYGYIGPGDTGFPSGLDQVAYRKPKKLFFVPEVKGSTQVSENFKRKEFIRANSTRGHYGHFSPLVVSRVQALREHFGRPLKINSGYRSPGYNATLNGAARFSRHTYGDAIDFRINGVSFSAIAQKCMDLGASFYQIYSSHIHCDWRNSPLEESVFGPPDSRELPRPTTLAVKSSLEDHSHIFAQRVGSSSSSQQKYKFYAETMQEDGGDLLYEWAILKGDELVHESTRANPIVRLTPGMYKVYVKVGGYLEVQDDLIIE